MQITSDSSILISGGTGSFGSFMVSKILNKFPNIRRLVIFSRDELKQYEMMQKYPVEEYPGLRFFLGDIRDKERLTFALQDIEIVIHAAALKQVPAAEYNPFEFIKTNIIGAQNVIEASLLNNVKKVIAISTDKAVSPINLYGATKLCSDKLFTSANNIKGRKNITFSVVRYGNVMGSRGSVVPLFMKEKQYGRLPITDLEMTRFNITLDEATELVLWSLENSLGGEIIIPKIPSYKITELAKAICPNCKLEIKGIRPGEKIHEEMISEADSLYTIDLGKYFIIISDKNAETTNTYLKKFSSTFVKPGFSYNSGSNSEFLDASNLRSIIEKSMGYNLS